MNYAKYAKYVFLVLFMTSTFTHAEDINSGMKNVIDIADTTIQSEISALKKRYKNDLNILYEDMSRKGQLNGTPMLDRLSKLCLNEIEDCALLIHDILLRVVENSGVNYSDELAAELKNVAKRHLTGEIGNINEYIKQKNKLGPTLEAQLAIKETELNNKRSNELKKINSVIDLLAISLRNQEKETVKMQTSEKQVKIPPSPNSSWLHKYKDHIIIGLIVTVVGGLIVGLILHFITKSPDQKQNNLKPSSNKGVISQTTLNNDVNGDVALERIEKKIDELNMKSTYNEIDKSVHTTIIDNSTNTTYSCDTPLSPEAAKLIDEKIEKALEKKLEKMNEHTTVNIKKACIDKPEEMGKFIEIFNLYKLSVAGNTVTTHNLMPWLTGETTVEPVGPMPSGDFIEQLPNAIDDVIDFDSIKDIDSVGAKMNQEQTYDNCSYFDIRNLCPHRDKKLMIDFIGDISIGIGAHAKQLDFSKAEEVNKKYCNPCASFKDKRS